MKEKDIQLNIENQRKPPKNKVTSKWKPKL
jgi:hypothetical protein